MHNKYKKYCTIHNTDTVAYATHSGSYSTERKKEVHYTHWYTTITAAHNIHNGVQHTQVGYLKVKPSTMLSVLIFI